MTKLEHAKKMVEEINRDISFDVQIDESRIKNVKDELVGTGYGFRPKENGNYFEIETTDRIEKRIFKRFAYELRDKKSKKVEQF